MGAVAIELGQTTGIISESYFCVAFLFRLTIIHILNLLSYHVLTVDITGYGETNDKIPTPDCTQRDIAFSIYQLEKLWPAETKLLWAHSLSTGLVSSALKETKINVEGIIMEAPIKSLLDCMKSSPLGVKLQKLWTQRIFNRMIEYHVNRCDFELETEKDILLLDTHLLILAAEDDESGRFEHFHLGLKLCFSRLDNFSSPLLTFISC